MKIPLSWLKDHLETDADAATIADTLTRIGLEVEGIGNPAEALRPFKVARVLTAERHPQADKLQVLTVDTGEGEALQVVCGAPNARAGMIGVFGGPGTYVPGSDFTLKKAAIRGVESNGMMCSARELMLGDDHDGIIELAEDAPVGTSFADYAALDDPVFDVNVTPNRPDCMGINGIARDLAAARLGTLKDLPVETVKGIGDPSVSVTIEDGSGCWIFWRREIRGVKNGSSPEWLQQRLKAAGLRPISALVDVTNFFSIDQARPLHVYDVAKLRGGIVARRGRKGDTFTALNDKEYAPTPEDIVIADERGAIGFGGVMGGVSTGVDESTTNVLLECAWFDPILVGATGRRHAIASDARARFERGIDPARMPAVIESATRMIIDFVGGDASAPAMVGSNPPPIGREIAYRPQRLVGLAGLDLPESNQEDILGRLGFAVESRGGGRWTVRIPTWRPDIDGEADIVEEIARIAGFDRIPAMPLSRSGGVAKPTATRAQTLERKVRRTAAARGLNEAVTWSFIAEDEAADFGGGAFTLLNPISEELKVMRPSLLPGLIAAARRNLDRGAQSVRLFEIGRRYLPEGEKPTLTLLLAGDRTPRDWQMGKGANFNVFDAKVEILALLDAAGAPVGNLQVIPGAGHSWHPGRSAALGLSPKNILARFGELHPSLMHGLSAGTVVAELYLDAVPTARASTPARPIFAPPQLQPVRRDFAFIVPADLAAGDLIRAIRSSDKALITEARVFDRFESSDGLSLAVEVTLQPTEKSFTDDEIAALSRRIVEAAEKLGARLRS